LPTSCRPERSWSCRASFAALDRAEVLAIHASLVREILLADAERLAAGAVRARRGEGRPSEL